MKNKIKFLLVAIVAIAMTVATSCKKDDNSSNPNTNSNSEFTTSNDDDNQVSSETDAMADDANTALATSLSLNGGRVEGGNDICGGTVVIDVDQNKATIAYNGITCDLKRKREGTVILSLPSGVKWKDVGAVLTIVADLKVTRISDGKVITLKGTYTVTNVNGGIVKELSPNDGKSIVHEISSNEIIVTFPNGSQRTWHVARSRTITYETSGYVISVTGTHTDGSNTHIAEWGTTRDDKSFVTSIVEPLVVRQDCYWRLVSGKINHQKDAKEASVTFGLDKDGNPTSTCPALTDHFFLKIQFNDSKGNPVTVILPY